MHELLAKSWWVLAVRGAVALLFGVLAILWPGITLLVLVALFAIYAIVGGLVALYGAVKYRSMDKGWWLILVLGIVSVAAGVLAVLKPDITVLALVLVMGVNALLTGALDLGVAIRLRKALHNEWLLILNGVASLAFGVLVLIFPAAGAFALVWLVSFYAVVSGILLLSLAFRLRALASRDDVSAFQSAVHH